MKKKTLRLWLWIGCLVLLLPAVQALGAVDITLRGEFIQGGAVFGQTCSQCRVVLAERDVPVSDQGKFIIGFGRDALPEQELLVYSPEGTTTRKMIAVRQRDYHIQRIDGISQRLMQPSAQDLERIRHEAEKIAAVRELLSHRDNFLEPFIWPLVGRITGVYGSQRILNGEPRQPHFGIDIAAPTGTPVKAPAGGKVTFIHPDMFYAGATLIVDHGHGLASTFLHLNEILVTVGEEVAQGQVIATVGASGRVTGPHLDWRLNWFDVRLDPALVVGEMPD